MQINSSHTFHCHTVSFRFVVFLYSDNNVLPEGNLPCHFALNVIKPYICSICHEGDQSAANLFDIVDSPKPARAVGFSSFDAQSLKNLPKFHAVVDAKPIYLIP
jgi:hypothetical protein